MTETWPKGLWSGEVKTFEPDANRFFITIHQTASDSEQHAEKAMRVVHRAIILGLLRRLPYENPQWN